MKELEIPTEIDYLDINNSYQIGDTNCDGEINISDATEIQKYLVDLISFDEKQKLKADVNGDGKVDICDATMIQKYLAKLITSFS